MPQPFDSNCEPSVAFMRRPLLTLPDLAAPRCVGAQLARDCGLTLIGFVRGSSHTVYAGVTAT